MHSGATYQRIFFSWMLAATCLWRLSSLEEETFLLLNFHGLGSMFAYATLLLSAQLLLMPGNYSIALLLCLLQVAHAIAKLPWLANHHFMTLFICFAVLAGWLLEIARSKTVKYSYDRAFEHFAPVGRMLLVVMYFFGTLHKINTDYLIPEVSCAVMMFRDVPIFPEFITESTWGQYAAIYGSLLIEGLAVIFLFFSRLKYYGIIMGLGFHFMIGVFEGGTIAHFSSVAFLCHMLFLPASAFTSLLAGKAGSFFKSFWQWRAATILFFGFLAFYSLDNNEPMERLSWALFSIPIIFFVLFYGRTTEQAAAHKSYYLSSNMLLNSIWIVFFPQWF